MYYRHRKGEAIVAPTCGWEGSVRNVSSCCRRYHLNCGLGTADRVTSDGDYTRRNGWSCGSCCSSGCCCCRCCCCGGGCGGSCCGCRGHIIRTHFIKSLDHFLNFISQRLEG